MDLATSETLKATCKVLGNLNSIGIGIWLVLSAFVMTQHAVAGVQIAVTGIVFFLLVLFLLRCGMCLAEIHTHFCRVEGLDRMPR